MNVSSHFGVQELLYSWNISTIFWFFMKKNENACHESLSNWNNWGKLYRSLSSKCSRYLDTCSLHLFISVRFFCVGLPRCSFLSFYNKAALCSLALWSCCSTDTAEMTQDIYICVELPAMAKQEMTVMTLLRKTSITLPFCLQSVPWCLSFSAASLLCGW